MNLYQVIRRPLITEKMSGLQDLRQYAFEVAPRANKLQVKAAVEKAFKVKVSSVNMMKPKGERKRGRGGFYVTPSWKKAVVTLREGFKIQTFEGV